MVVKRPGRPLVWTACDCPAWVISAFQVVDRAKEQYIGQLELLAAVMAYTTFPDLLSGQYVIHWIDNESAVYSLVKGYCGAADSARLVNVFHTTISRLGIFPWIEYVGTDDNIADLLSRGEFDRYSDGWAVPTLTDQRYFPRVLLSLVSFSLSTASGSVPPSSSRALSQSL